MLGILGALGFGAVAAGAWIDADQTEQQGRQSSKEHGHEFYFDKNGKMRHVDNGKKYTPEEIHQFYNPVPLEERKREYDKNHHDQFDYKYFQVYNVHDHNIKEIFLTEEEAKQYVSDNYKEEDFWLWKIISKTCKHIIDSDPEKYHLNF